MATSKFRSVTSRLGIAPPAGGRALLVALATVVSVVFGGAIAPSVANASSTKHSRTVDVLYAGSLLDLMQQQIGPAFHKATGYTVTGFSAGSSALSTDCLLYT